MVTQHVDAVWRDRFPGLFESVYLDDAGCDMSFTVEPFPLDLVTRLHVLAVPAPGRVLVCRTDNGWRFLPGGTREPGETLQQTTERELLEEAGARVRGEVDLFATHIADSRSPTGPTSHIRAPTGLTAWWWPTRCRRRPTRPTASRSSRCGR